MDSDRAANDGTGDAIGVEWVDEHAVDACNRETTRNIGTFGESGVNLRRCCPVRSTLREDFLPSFVFVFFVPSL
jgi:hypothetical protein